MTNGRGVEFDWAKLAEVDISGLSGLRGYLRIAPQIIDIYHNKWIYGFTCAVPVQSKPRPPGFLP